jgi:hypothetical protein
LQARRAGGEQAGQGGGQVGEGNLLGDQRVERLIGQQAQRGIAAAGIIPARAA